MPINQSRSSLTRKRSLGRRTLLRNAVFAAGALGPMNVYPSARTRVIVLGAGLAGLHAARLLAGQGYEVLVLEARSRVGGRLLTLDDLPGKPEGGGNVIGPNYGRVIHTARELNVELEVPPTRLGSGIRIGEASMRREEWATSQFNPLPEGLRSLAPDRLASSLLADNPLTWASAWRDAEFSGHDQSATDFFASKGLDARALRLVDVNNSYGNRLDETSVLSLYRVQANVARGMDMRQPTLQVRGGNMRLPEAMATNLAGRVQLDAEVLRVEQNPDGLRVWARDGRTWAADRVICTLPATVVRRMEFQPGLPIEQRLAVEGLHYHKVTQAHLIADHPWWEAHGAPASWWTDGPLGRIFTVPTGDGSGRFNITCWINGDGCDRFDRVDSARAEADVMGLFLGLFPQARGHVRFGELVRWSREEFNQGTWAIWRPGDIARFADRLLRPHDRVFFAGEHTAYANAGMEAAMASGERAVLEVMRLGA